MSTPLPLAMAELARWRAEGLTLPVWWRDDDAIEPTPALDRLLALAERFRAPLHLAIVPQPAQPELAERLRNAVDVFALTHGWKHANHAPPDRKKAEFGAYRPLPVMLGEIAEGRKRLRDLFGDKALPIFTPPWNRIADAVVSQLAPVGYKAISTYTPRATRFAADGLLQVNTHLDPVAWKSGGGLLGPDQLDAQMSRELEARRTGSADNGEPYGVLTHHLVQDDATWFFTERLLETLAASGVARFTSPLDG
ncbi:MAG: polysaccharide deacetylase family protein [Mesorhizobium sp.]|nr:polysaccharide deacetylase family protein [Mesorhizobium sp.]MBL8579461.1 polysaccharide deacetylase family protein [Mesorhizobium sp.]